MKDRTRHRTEKHQPTAKQPTILRHSGFKGFIALAAFFALALSSIVAQAEYVKLNVLIMRKYDMASGMKVPVVFPHQAESDLKINNERFAQVGIKATWAIDTVNIVADFVPDNFMAGHPPTSSLIQQYGTASSGHQFSHPNDIHVFYVNELHDQYNREINGWTVSPDATAEYHHNILMAGATKTDFVLAHEVAHTLTLDMIKDGKLDDEGHHSSPINLLRGNGVSTENTIGASKRLTREQGTYMNNKALEIDPQ